MARRKIFTAVLIAETNPFSPIRVDRKAFELSLLTEEPLRDANEINYWASSLKGLAEVGRKNDWEIVESLKAVATPGGYVDEVVYQEFKAKILADLQGAMPVDGIFLALHGAMQTENCFDCEGDLLAAVREVAGSDCSIVVELDPHCSITPAMSSSANLLMCYRTYPHTDVQEVAVELAECLRSLIEKELELSLHLVSACIIESFPTVADPMRSFMKEVSALEAADNGIVKVVVQHGFPWSDDPYAGASILIATDPRLTDKGDEYATELAEKLFELRGKTMPKFYEVSEALEFANQSKYLPAIIGDFADNASGGAPSNSSFVLEEAINSSFERLAVGCLWEPEAVAAALRARKGATLSVDVGGRFADVSGKRLRLEVEVLGIQENYHQRKDGGIWNMGNMVGLKIKDRDIYLVLTSTREQTFLPACFTDVGIDLHDLKAVVVKSSAHFRAAFSEVAGRLEQDKPNIILVKTPGTLCPDPKLVKYERITRPIWPLDERQRLADYLVER